VLVVVDWQQVGHQRLAHVVHLVEGPAMGALVVGLLALQAARAACGAPCNCQRPARPARLHARRAVPPLPAAAAPPSPPAPFPAAPRCPRRPASPQRPPAGGFGGGVRCLRFGPLSPAVHAHRFAGACHIHPAKRMRAC
jgi:hypothetical protein